MASKPLLAPVPECRTLFSTSITSHGKIYLWYVARPLLYVQGLLVRLYARSVRQRLALAISMLIDLKYVTVLQSYYRTTHGVPSPVRNGRYLPFLNAWTNQAEPAVLLSSALRVSIYSINSTYISAFSCNSKRVTILESHRTHATLHTSMLFYVSDDLAGTLFCLRSNGPVKADKLKGVPAAT